MRSVKTRFGDRGNILFLILLAVVLFAALAYAVTSSLRGGGKDASGESTQVKANTVTQFFDQIDAALMRMQLTQGIKIENISFELPYKNYTNYLANAETTGGTYWVNSNCTSDTCRVFKPDGGNVSPRNFQRYGVDDFYGFSGALSGPGQSSFIMMQWAYAGTDLNDIIIEITGIDPAICPVLNAGLDISSTPAVFGNRIGQNDPSGWDNTALSMSTAAQRLLIGKNTYGEVVSSGGSGSKPHCRIRHLLIAR